MQLYQQVERLMLQNHNAGDVVGEVTWRPSWSVTVRSAKVWPVKRLALSSVRPSSKGVLTWCGPNGVKIRCVLNYITKPGAMVDRIYPHHDQGISYHTSSSSMRASICLATLCSAGRCFCAACSMVIALAI